MFEYWRFLIQVAIFLSYIPITYIAYRLLREPKKHERAEWELKQIADEEDEEFQEALRTAQYSNREYAIPIIYIIFAMSALYAMTHPDIIQHGVWVGLLETNIEVLKTLGGGTIAVDILFGRFLFWAWLGAYIYSVERTVRHYLANDLNPSVYISATLRFVVAFVIAAMLTAGFAVLGNFQLGTFSISTDTQLVILYLVSFVTGLFPERGMRWIVSRAGTALGSTRKENDEIQLSDIEGISYWQRGRLEDEGIENIQNLATAHLLTLVTKTPYDVGQIVDWVDQAVLLTYSTKEQQSSLKSAGLYRASAILQVAEGNLNAYSKLIGMPPEALELIKIQISKTKNIQPILKYRGIDRHLLADRITTGDQPESIPAPDGELTLADANSTLPVGSPAHS